MKNLINAGTTNGTADFIPCLGFKKSFGLKPDRFRPEIFVKFSLRISEILEISGILEISSLWFKPGILELKSAIFELKAN